ncbi:adenylosuccinate lyase family protein [Franzmannia qiaohouensis]|uniref:Adenylosuccinate lyase family protein n=1 Tax=Franzmannia qiaohouensis TaxID=1329370 RepID=A0ABU1HDP7_9GAMM|nr:adenylosuccinate lyase family protein [Halomonas qiaohouensis]MDR5905596.1 adenylosuccinate lyase family protein [Halomonas qiaohouensis]
MSLASTAPGLLADKAGYRRTGDIFGEEGTIDAYLAFERSLAEVQGALGVIPREAVAPILKACQRDNLEREALRRDAAQVGYPVVALVEQLASRAGPPGQWVHYGATTQDVMDTALALQIRQVADATLDELASVETLLAELAIRHRHTLMIGRSKLQHAVPITFGYKVAVWLDQLIRRRKVLARAVQEAAVVQFGGATGTLASLNGQGVAVRAALARQLGLGEPDISWHVTRDRVVDVIYAEASLAAALGKIATDIALMMSTEVGELREPAAEGRGSSSTMPQKRNPVLCEAIIEAARDVRGTTARALDAMLQDHERGIGHGYGERRALAAAMMETAGAVSLTLELLQGLEVNAAAMVRNVKLSRGLVYAEAAMLELADELGRVEAHHLIRKICQDVEQSELTLPQALAEAGLNVPESTFHTETQVGALSTMIDRVVMKARSRG